VDLSITKWAAGVLLAIGLCVLPAERAVGAVPSTGPPSQGPSALSMPQGTALILSPVQAKSRPTSLPAEMPEDRRVRAWGQTMVWGVVLLVILVFAAAAIVVFSRRYSTCLASKRSAPTPVDDVWLMHDAPDVDADDDDDDDADDDDD